MDKEYLPNRAQGIKRKVKSVSMDGKSGTTTSTATVATVAAVGVTVAAVNVTVAVNVANTTAT